jgi:hypothetical protein
MRCGASAGTVANTNACLRMFTPGRTLSLQRPRRIDRGPCLLSEQRRPRHRCLAWRSFIDVIDCSPFTRSSSSVRDALDRANVSTRESLPIRLVTCKATNRSCPSRSDPRRIDSRCRTLRRTYSRRGRRHRRRIKAHTGRPVFARDREPITDGGRVMWGLEQPEAATVRRIWGTCRLGSAERSV